MNKIYKVIWNKSLLCWQVVSELGKNNTAQSQSVIKDGANLDQHKAVSSHLLSLTGLGFALALLPLSIYAEINPNSLPTGATVTQGSAQFNQNNNTLNITQNTQNLSTHWNSFNIGQDATVNFNQPNSSSIAINRVLDSNASQIMGRLNANGQIFLLNPNGVVFSKTAQVNVGGIVASTLNLADSDLTQGKFTLKNNGSAGSIENYGSIIAHGGVVALIAPVVNNQGSIQNNGTGTNVVHLTAADQVSLQLQDGRLTEYKIDLGTLQGLVDNGGAIQANNGAVYLTAKAKDSLSKAVVNHTGIIEANRLSQNAKGEIILLGDMQNGTTTVSGTLKAEGKNSADGGFIETSAADVKIDQTTAVSTRSDSGKTGTWLIDPTDFNINAGNAAQSNSEIGATTLQNNLVNTSVNLQTNTTDTGSQKGNINVNADVTWGSANSLTLNAHNDININANITATNNNGKLNLIYGQNAANTNANYYINNGAKINLKAGQNFSTQKGTAATINYQVITALGAQGSTTARDLQGINGNLSGNYVLGNDIDASDTVNWNNGAGFNPIGQYVYNDPTKSFTGKLDGLGHAIHDLNIKRSSQDYIGLLGATNGATLQNIAVVGGAVTGSYYVGGLVGVNDSNSTISNAYATGAVTGSFGVGGLVGSNENSTISNAYATGTVTGSSTVGGLVGWNDNSTISNVYATGVVTGNNNNVGGLVGWNDNSTISNAYATGAVTGNNSVGGLVGVNDSNSTISNAYATGAVTGNWHVGGLVGGNYNSSISNGYWNTETTGQTVSAGGGTGLTTAEMFDKSKFTDFDFSSVWGNGDNQTTPYLLGLANNQVFNKNDLPTGTISSTNRPALYTAILNVHQLQNINNNLSGNYLLGNDIDASDTVNWNSGSGFNPIGQYVYNDPTKSFTGKLDGLGQAIHDLNINRSAQAYIGLLGATNGATLQNIAVVGGSVTGSNNVGGLVGYNFNSKISNAYATGAVTGSGSVGGLVGWNDNSTISNAYATGAVTGNNNVGGLVGYNFNSKISNAYATGAVTGNWHVGGLVGGNYNSSISNGYWNTETTGQTVSAGGGTGLTTAEMFDKSKFTDFDFSSVWGNGDNQTTPYLLGLANNQVFNKNDLPTGTISSTNRPALYTAILNVHQLQNINNNLSGNYLLGNDIDASDTVNWNSGSGFNPIGQYVYNDPTKSFTGKLDGLGHAIHDLNIKRSSQDYIGLLGATNGATLQNIAVVGGSVTGSNNVGGLVGVNDSNSTISNAYATGAVTGIVSVGGLVGWNDNSTISNAYATGAVTGNNNVGGLVGYNFNSTISNAYATGAVTGNNNVGGLVGYNYVNSTISNAYATGAVRGSNYVGGLVGENYNSSIRGGYWNTETTGQTISDGGGTGLTTAQMQHSASFNGFDIDDVGGTGKTWRIYEGQTAPLLRSFLTQARINATDKTLTYNGQTQSLDIANFTGLDNSKIFGSQSSSKNVGNYLLQYYSNQQGYDLIDNTATLKINPAALTITANNTTKTYGDTTTFAGTEFSASGLQNGETIGHVGLSSNGALATAGVNGGIPYAIKASNAAGGTFDASNYTISYSNGNLIVTKKDITVTANGGTSIYGDTNQVNPNFSTTGLVNGETESVLTGLNNSFGINNTTNAGSYSLTVDGTLTNGNYNITQRNDGTWVVGKKDITVTANGGTSIYGDTNQVNPNFNASGLVNGETESVLTGLNNSFGINNVTNAGSYSLTVDGTLTNGNYNITQRNDGTWVVGKKDITVTANGGTSIYGDTNQVNPNFNASGLVNGETTAVLTGLNNSFSINNTTNAGSYSLTVDGTLTNGNYNITQRNDGTWVVAKANATVIANSNHTAVYNGKDQSVTGFTATGLVNGETEAVLTGVTASGTGKNAGSYNSKATGSDNNYNLTFVDGSLDIAKANATVIANSNHSAIYNGKDQSVTGFTATGLVNGETESVLTGVTASATGKNAGSYSSKATGSDANYNLTFVDGSLDIAKANATVTANSNHSAIYNGKDQSVTGFTVTGLVNGETESVLTGVTASGTGKNAGSYSSKATGSDSNYNLTFIDGSLDIAKAQLHLNAVSDTRTYDGTNASTGLVSITGLQGNDSASATQVFDSRNAGNRTLNVTGVVINDGNNGNNYIVQTQNATGTINKALITQVDGITANSRFFDGTTNATLNFNNSQLLGKITGDDLYVASAQGQFSDLGIGQDKTVNINNIQLAGADAANYQLIKNTAQTTANMTLLTPTGYLQAIQFQPVTDHQIQPQNSARIDVQNGGVNINGLQVMKGGY